jgi:hypothetical protein
MMSEIFAFTAKLCVVPLRQSKLDSNCFCEGWVYKRLGSLPLTRGRRRLLQKATCKLSGNFEVDRRTLKVMVGRRMKSFKILSKKSLSEVKSVGRACATCAS